MKVILEGWELVSVIMGKGDPCQRGWFKVAECRVQGEGKAWSLGELLAWAKEECCGLGLSEVCRWSSKWWHVSSKSHGIDG